MGKMKKKNKGGGGTKRKASFAKKRNSSGKNTPAVRSSGFGTAETADKVKVDNPFEIRMHRPKHDNLGRRARWEKGQPGVSRGKAIEKRRETLLKEYKVRSKSNVILDKRIGEKVKNMPEEEKIARRSVMEKRRQYKQKSIFNLPSTDDMLTHKGQMLMDIDRYEDPRDESDSEDERLNEEFVSDAHFAGDFLKVKQKSEEEPDEDDNKSRKDIIAELILNSKKRKMEKAKEADETYELVSKLDDEFKTPDFRNLLNFVKKGVNEHVEPPEPPKKEEYDRIVRELHFEAKTGLASNRLKTEAEVQEEELNKLKKLEKDRLKRMRAQDPSIPNHRSADDLGDEYEIDEDIPVLSYKKDGKLNQSEDESGSDDEEVDEEENPSDQEDEEIEEEESGSDAFSDLESDNENAEVEQVSKKKSKNVEVDDQSLSTEENDDIPFIITLPKSYERFKKLMGRYRAVVKDEVKCVERYKLVLERLVKYSLLAEKERLPQMFVYVLKFLTQGVEGAGVITKNIREIIMTSAAHLHTILLSNTEKCVEIMETDVIPAYLSCGKGNKITLAKIALFQVCSKIFCVTDFCHRVLSPMKVNILELINSSSCSNYVELLKILALVDITFDVTKDSKRYCPEVIKLLLDILEGIVLPPEKLRVKRRRFEFLRLDNLFDCSDLGKAHAAEDICLKDSEEGVGPPTKAQVLSLLLRVFDLLNNFIQSQHKTRPFYHLVFEVMKTQLLVLNMKWENTIFQKELFSKKLSKDCIASQGEKIEDDLLSVAIERPKMLKLYEPMIEENFDGSKKRKLKRKGLSQEEAKLSYKVKKEMKSAAREILKDNAFLAKQQMKEQAMKDAERNRRVKEILGGLSNQEGDYRKIRKQK